MWGTCSTTKGISVDECVERGCDGILEEARDGMGGEGVRGMEWLEDENEYEGEEEEVVAQDKRKVME